jgi:hypothetical protein
MIGVVSVVRSGIATTAGESALISTGRSRHQDFPLAVFTYLRFIPGFHAAQVLSLIAAPPSSACYRLEPSRKWRYRAGAGDMFVIPCALLPPPAMDMPLPLGCWAGIAAPQPPVPCLPAPLPSSIRATLRRVPRNYPTLGRRCVRSPRCAIEAAQRVFIGDSVRRVRGAAFSAPSLRAHRPGTVPGIGLGPSRLRAASGTAAGRLLLPCALLCSSRLGCAAGRCIASSAASSTSDSLWASPCVSLLAAAACSLSSRLTWSLSAFSCPSADCVAGSSAGAFCCCDFAAPADFVSREGGFAAVGACGAPGEPEAEGMEEELDGLLGGGCGVEGAVEVVLHAARLSSSKTIVNDPGRMAVPLMVDKGSDRSDPVWPQVHHRQSVA